MKKVFILINLITLIVLKGFISNIFAATIIVSNTANDGSGSLRAAINAANADFLPDNIIFNIPLNDPNYNSATGIWTITLTTALPYIQTPGITIDGTTQASFAGNTNPHGPEILITCNTPLQQCFGIGTSGNTIKGLAIGGFAYGIVIYGNLANNNTITDNYIGAEPTGNAALANDFGVVVSNAAAGNLIINNLISGNTTSGIAVNEAGTTTIKGNRIGTNSEVNAPLPNGMGIVLNKASNNQIGGTNSSERNIISGNTDNGIAIVEPQSTNNTIIGNFIGTDSYGMMAVPNGFGVLINKGSNNKIGGSNTGEGNLISGNIQAGIVFNGSGTQNNQIKGNTIGLNVNGNAALSNQVGILLKSQSNKNQIGGHYPADANLISGNWEIGVYLEGCDSNIISGNIIGPDKSGALPIKSGDTLVQGNGVELNTVSRYNRVGGYSSSERNIISGNRVYGFVYYGNSSYNPLIGNYIGTDISGNHSLPNATGICVDGGSHHNPMINNVLSGNISYGIFIVTTGTYYNIMQGNIVGLNAAGVDTLPNDAGLLLGGGTRYNLIGGDSSHHRNIFSGNRYNGIEIADNTTDFNLIKGNYIGTDITGTLKRPNTNGIGIIAKPRKNRFERNVISGNRDFGVVLYQQTDSNYFFNNRIGTDINGQLDLGNGKSGILIASGSSGNIIGNTSDTSGLGNIIAYNDTAGIIVMDATSKRNRISGNSFYANVNLAIDLFPPGPTANDAGDTDSGPNELMNYPAITSAVYDSNTGNIWISGTIDCTNPTLTQIELYIADPDPFNQGEGEIYLGKTSANSNGSWNVVLPGATPGCIIAALAIDAEGNTSEFSFNFNSSTLIEEPSFNTSEPQIFPNPADDALFVISSETFRKIQLLSITGQTITELNNQNDKTLSIDLSNLEKGFYILRLITIDNKVFQKKIFKK